MVGALKYHDRSTTVMYSFYVFTCAVFLAQQKNISIEAIDAISSSVSCSISSFRMPQVRRLFTQFDADGSGGLDVNEFNALMVALEHPSGSPDGDGESLLAKFRSLDAGGGGHLSEFELGQWLGSLPDRQVLAR
jgi:Ca2+-binding EF-hand superfamily protein